MSYPELKTIKNLYDGLIFDLDGTLLDSMNLWTDADKSFLSKRGLELTSDYTNYVKSVSIEDAAEYTKNRFNLPDSPQEIINEWNSFVRRGYTEHVPLKNGAGDYILEAHKNGFVIGCATALTRPNAEAVLKRCGIYDLFDTILTLDDIKGCPDKRQPDIYLKTAHSMGTPISRTLIFEDVPLAMNGAMSGGFDVCAVYDSVGIGSEDEWVSMTQKCKYSILSWIILD